MSIPDASQLKIEWHKASYSASHSNCVEQGLYKHGAAIRDTKRPSGPALSFGAGAWESFVAALQVGGVTG